MSQCLAALVLLVSSIFDSLRITLAEIDRFGSAGWKFHFSRLHGGTLERRARDRPCGRLGSSVHCALHTMYPSSVGVQFALSAVSLLSRPESMMSAPVWVPPRSVKFNKYTSNEATPTY